MHLLSRLWAAWAAFWDYEPVDPSIARVHARLDGLADQMRAEARAAALDAVEEAEQPRRPRCIS